MAYVDMWISCIDHALSEVLSILEKLDIKLHNGREKGRSKLRTYREKDTDGITVQMYSHNASRRHCRYIMRILGQAKSKS